MGTKIIVPLLAALLLRNVFCQDPTADAVDPTEKGEDRPHEAKENKLMEADAEVRKGMATYPVNSQQQLHHFIERHNSIDYMSDPTELDYDPTEKPDTDPREISQGFQNPASVVAFQGVCEPLSPGGWYDNRIPNMNWMRICTGPYAADNICQIPIEGAWMQCLEVEQPMRPHPTEDDILLHQEMKKYFGAAKCGGELHGDTMPFPQYYLSWSTYKEKGRKEKKLICITGASTRDREMKKRCTTCQCKGCRGHCEADLEYWISNVVPDVHIKHPDGGEDDEVLEEFDIPQRQSDNPFPSKIGSNYKEIRKALMEKITHDRVQANIKAERDAEAERLKIENGETGEE